MTSPTCSSSRDPSPAARADLARTRLSRGAKRLLLACAAVGLLPDGTTRSAAALAQEMRRKELDREEKR